MIDPYHRELLVALQPTVAAVTKNHIDSQRNWMPSELLPKGFETQNISPETAAMLVMNMLTEDGLPWFTSLLVKHLGDEGPLFEWNQVWTAEEGRHGGAIALYLHHALPQEEIVAVERMEYEYLRGGFWPNWNNNPLRLMAYVVMQEQATMMSHAGISRRARHEDPLLQDVMAKISREEDRHHLVYRAFFKRLFELDPSAALDALDKVIGSFVMPGENMPAFKNISYLQERLGVFGPKQLATIVKKFGRHLNIEDVIGLTSEGERARDNIMRRVTTLERLAEREAKKPTRKVHLPFLGNDIFVIA